MQAMTARRKARRERSALRRGAGFTLIELLVVIAIVAVLASLTLPALSYVRRSARAAACQSNLHSLGMAMRVYLNRSNNVLPVAAQMPSLGLTDEPRIVDVLARFVDDVDVFRCPSDTAKNYYASEGSSYEYHTIYGGRRLQDLFLTQQFGESNVPLLNDYEPFHGEPGEAGSTNYLFADGHVGDLE